MCTWSTSSSWHLHHPCCHPQPCHRLCSAASFSRSHSLLHAPLMIVLLTPLEASAPPPLVVLSGEANLTVLFPLQPVPLPCVGNPSCGGISLADGRNSSHRRPLYISKALVHGLSGVASPRATRRRIRWWQKVSRSSQPYLCQFLERSHQSQPPGQLTVVGDPSAGAAASCTSGRMIGHSLAWCIHGVCCSHDESVFQRG